MKRKTNLKKMILGALLLAATGTIQAGAVYSPEPGVICDRKSHFCADKSGISYGLTEEYLGTAAMEKFRKMTAGAGDSFDTTVFTMSNGLNCDTKKKICKKSKWDDRPDPHWTRILFGSMHRENKHYNGTRWTGELKEAANDCKVYLSDKYKLPMAAFRPLKAHKKNGAIVVIVKSDWDEPRVEETGECIVKGGNISYRRTGD